MAYIPGGGQPHTPRAADLISAAVNRYTGSSRPAPALVQLETNVIRWFVRAVGYPQRGRRPHVGRVPRELLGGRRGPAREAPREPSSKGHALRLRPGSTTGIRKAALLAGFPAANVREIPVRFRVPHAPLTPSPHASPRTGRPGFTPFLVVASAGTVNTGAVDDLNALADFAAK